ncbi:MAG: HPF/RaiA family ribosome-associated protein [Verrucomicrobiae bacterium]|nr:HPF/RaiA family ribosome-associated protein [Verrucomicrobiae bacterium]
MTQQLLLPWNIVARNFTPHEQLKQWVQREIKKLEKHLTNFPHESVHLQVVFEMHKRTKKFTSSLTLRLPSNLLNAKAIDGDPISALAKSMKALIKEVEHLKNDLRHIKDKHRIREKIAESGKTYTAPTKSLSFAPEPLPDGKGPQDIAELLKQVIEDNFPRLLDYIKRQIEYFESAKEVPINSIDAEAVLDEVVTEALKHPQHKPEGLGYIQWIYQLINDELNKRHRMFKRLRKAVPLEDLEESYTESEEITPLMLSMLNEPPSDEFPTPSKNFVPSRTLPPDEELAEKEFIEELIENAQSWDKLERDVFELHFIEGFSAEDCAMILKIDTEELRKTISNIHERIRRKIIEEMWIK